MRHLLLLVSLCLTLTGCWTDKNAPVPEGYEPKAGDFLFQSFPHNPLSDAIEGCTNSVYSHCGMVVQREGEWYVLEAVGPVKSTPLGAWIVRGRKGFFVAYRLRDPLQQKVPAIITAATKYEGRPYDLGYEMDDQRIYCSELLWKAVRDATGQKIGQVQKLGELNWQPHEAFIRTLKGGKLPLEQEMITPRALSEAAELKEVYRQPIVENILKKR